jgi:hypothetical protein
MSWRDFARERGMSDEDARFLERIFERGEHGSE